MSAPTSAVKTYYVPHPSRWPIIGACALLLSAAGAATWVNRGAAGPYKHAPSWPVGARLPPVIQAWLPRRERNAEKHR